MMTCYYGAQFERRIHELQQKLTPTENTLLQPHIVILPSNRYKRRFINTLSALNSDLAYSPANVFSYYGFLESTYQFLSHIDHETFSKKPISAYLKEKLMAARIQNLQGQFVYYQSLNSGKTPMGAVRRFIRLIDELILAGYSAASFQTQVELENIEKIQDIQRVFTAFEEAILDHYYDQTYIPYDLLKYYTEKQFQLQFGEIQSISFLYFDKYSHGMLHLIERLSAFVPQLDLHINGDLESDLMQHTAYDLSYLSSLGMKKNVDAAPFSQREKAVFSASFASLEDELQAILEEISRLQDQDNVPLNKIIIAYPNLDAHAQLVRTLCHRFAIDFNMTSQLQLIKSAVAQLFLTIFQLKQNHFHYSDIYRFYSSNFVENTSIDLTLFMKFISARKIEYVQKKHIESLENTDEFQSLAAPLFLLFNDVSDTFSACKTAPEFQSRFFTFLEKYGVLKSESLVSNEENGRSLLRLKELFDQLSSIWAGQLQDFSVDTFLTDFIEELKGENFQLREVKGVGIQIMPMLEARAESPDVLFIAGLNQSAFPKSLSQPVIFNQHEREALKLLTPDFSIQEDQYVLELLLAKDCSCYVSDHTFESNVDGRSLLLYSALALCTQHAWPKTGITLGKRYEKQLSAEFSESEFQALGIEHLPNSSFRKKMESHVYSASQIERYLACPYRYFVEDVLVAREEKGVELDQTPAEFGTLLHHILFRLYKECPTIRTAPISSRLEKIKAVLEDEVAQNNVEALRISIAHISDILEEDAQIAGEFEPRFFEWRFGYSSKEGEDQHSTNRVLKVSQNGREAQFQGQIDRVDLNENNQAIVIDYKSSSKLTTANIIKGESFQLLLYILAATELLTDVNEVETAFIFTIANSKKISKDALLGDLDPYKKRATKYKNDHGEELTFDAFLDASKERILDITENILSGKFPLRPSDISQKLESCIYCPAKAVCRIREKLMHYPEEIRNLS